MALAIRTQNDEIARPERRIASRKRQKDCQQKLLAHETGVIVAGYLYARNTNRKEKAAVGDVAS